MRLKLSCVGRMKAGSESEIFDRFMDRARKSGRRFGLSRIEIVELLESRLTRRQDRKREEAAGLLSAMAKDARLVALDERGTSMTSVDFSRRLFSWVDEGVSETVFAIGGPDGHGDEVLQRAHLRLALGQMTWPHQFVRMMVAEQIYRAITIRAGHPYHRD
ncbi:MAG: 23S rRNA (pseudouridine(1915)-N(3))-methyltransferase RlmH [Roseibium sp.]|nr:23S rRNA (pseudouridine(1915)-N(3))-methyltransferase RlmH [Roseibium sp.]